MARPSITFWTGQLFRRQLNAVLDWLEANGGITVQDEGGNITTALATMNFVGAGVTVTGGATAMVTIPGGGASSGSFMLDDGTATAGGVFTLDDGAS